MGLSQVPLVPPQVGVAVGVMVRVGVLVVVGVAETITYSGALTAWPDAPTQVTV